MTPASSGTQPAGDERDLARRVLTHEAGVHAAPRDAVAATDRLLGQLHDQLAHWLGLDGSYAVLARALDRARAEHPALAGARLEAQGAERRPGLAGLEDQPGTHDPAATFAAMAGVLAGVLALLTRLIGAELVTRLVRQTWPDEITGVSSTSEVASPLPLRPAGAERPTTPRTPHEDAPSD